jgi:hypothetical protein
MYVNNVFSTFPPPPGGTANNILYIGIIGPQFCQLLGRAYCGTLWLAIALGGNPFPITIFSFHRNCICFLIFYCLSDIAYEKPPEFSPLNHTRFLFCKRIQNKLSQGVWYNHGNPTQIKLK